MNCVEPLNSQIQPGMEKSNQWNLRIAQIILVLFSLVFTILSVVGLFETCRLDPASYNNEHILFCKDNLFLNILILVLLVFVMMVVLIKIEHKIQDKDIRKAKVALGIWIFLLSLLWVFSTQTIPTSDSMLVLDAASRAALNDFSFLLDSERYFQMFPFQLGMVSVFEVGYRIFGSSSYYVFCALNAAALSASFLAVVQLADAIFRRRVVTMMAVLLSACCIQPILFTSFIYGTLYGLAAILWAFNFFVRFLHKPNLVNSIWVLLLCSFSVLIKPNYWIVVVAIGIILLLSLPYGHKVAKLAFLSFLIALPIVLNISIRSSYERRGNVDLGAGTPQIAWMVMGLSNTKNNPGWYNGYTFSVLKNAGWDEKITSEQVMSDLSERVQVLIDDPVYAFSFFSGKFLSQWNETSFESVWTSKLREHYREVPAFIHSVYGGSLGKVLYFGFDQYIQLLYTLCTLAILTGRKSKKKSSMMDYSIPPIATGLDTLNQALLPLTILGGVFYHLLFEAKSYYAIPYLVMLIPSAAFGAAQTLDALKGRKFVRRLLPENHE